MSHLTKRTAALLMGRLLILLGAWGVGELPPGAAERIETWIGHSLELLIDLATISLGAWLRGRAAPPPGREASAARNS